LESGSKLPHSKHALGSSADFHLAGGTPALRTVLRISGLPKLES